MIRSRRTANARHAFTLIELLIVMTILVLLLAVTVPAVRYGFETERVRGGASQVQSYVAGARDRAIYQGTPFGVRLFLDNTELLDTSGASFTGNRRAVASMVYINPSQTWSDGTIQLQRMDGNNDGTVDTTFDIDGDGTPASPGDPAAADETFGESVYVVAGVGTGWWELKRRGMLYDGLKIQIPAGGTTYPVSTGLIDTTVAPTAVQKLILQIPYRDDGSTPEGSVQAFSEGGPHDYVLELPPAIVQGQPSILPDKVVIDLDASKLPVAWRPSTTNGFNFTQYMDIIFSPRGNVVGTAASAGLIHLYVCDAEDSLELKQSFIQSLAGASTAAKLVELESAVGSGTHFTPAPEIDPDAAAWASDLAETDGDASTGDKYLAGDRRVVSIFTQTGNIAVHEVSSVDVLDPFDVDGDTITAEPDGLVDDPFRLAETGQEAK